MAEVVADKGYHSTETVFAALQIRSYISEPKRGRRKWKGNIEGRDATYANRRRIRGERGRELLRRRGEKLERSFAHLYRTGGMRRTEVRGHDNVAKRLLIQAGAFNLGRQKLGAGTPRALHARILCALLAFFGLRKGLRRRISTFFEGLIGKLSIGPFPGGPRPKSVSGAN